MAWRGLPGRGRGDGGGRAPGRRRDAATSDRPTLVGGAEPRGGLAGVALLLAVERGRRRPRRRRRRRRRLLLLLLAGEDDLTEQCRPFHGADPSSAAQIPAGSRRFAGIPTRSPLLSSHPPSSYHQQQQKIASSSFPSPRARASRLPPPLVASLLLLLLLFLLVFFLSLACNNYFFSFFSPFCFLLFSHAPPRYLVFLDDALFLPLSFSLCLVCNLCVYCAIWWVIWLLSFLVHFCVFFFYCEKKMALWVTSLTRLY